MFQLLALNVTMPTKVLARTLSAIVSVITAAVTGVVTAWITVRRLRREYLLEMQAESLVHRLLSDERWRLRSFETLKHHVADFSEDELRRVLIRAGAIRFEIERIGHMGTQP